ncbi:MAG: lytic transglycosylase domain-containing protein [Chloroflexi bacterium]|nr:MAG: lytic transglycosylase domain-containing protein [Chloroflexota bacterium]
MRPPVLRLIAPMLAVALSACGASQAGTASRASTPAATPTLSPTAAPTPRVTVVDAAYLATELGGVEQGIRLPDSPAEEYLSLGRRALPASIRSAVQANISAAQQIDDLNGASSALPHWRIIAPPAPEVLLSYYREVQQAYGIAWQYLAAINLIETNMGRIQGLSSAGAQGPMQFMPATWASYGRGDVNNPRDAILAAGRYLQAHGAPANMTRAIYAYNPSMLYVRAVQLYAEQMLASERAFLAYYNWEVYVQTKTGEVLLPEGFSG